MSRTVVMGILNITPDSFADGGKYLSKDDAVTGGRRLVVEGADIIDVGGESTRPGAERVSETEELKRVIPVIKELVKDGAVVSVDTMRAEVAKEAIAVGATYINDVSGGLADEKMAKVIASNPKVQYIVMHWRGHSKNMQEQAIYKDVVKEVKEELDERVSYLLKAGVSAKDPSEREAATIALTTELARLKVWGVRTHAVKAHQDAISVIERMRK